MLAAPLDSFRSRAPPSWLAPTRSSLHPPGHWREESPPAPPIHGIALYLSAMPSDLLSLTRRVLVFFVFSPRQVAAVLNFCPRDSGRGNLPEPALGEPAWVRARASHSGGRGGYGKQRPPAHTLHQTAQLWGSAPPHPTSAFTAGDALGSL